MKTRQSRESGKGNKKKDRNSSPSVDSPFGGSRKSGTVSPSNNSTCSSSSTDRETRKKNKTEESQPKGKKRQALSDSEDKNSKKKKSEDRSDSESLSDSSSLSCNDEEIGNDDDIENNQDDLSSSSQPSTPRSLETDFKPTSKSGTTFSQSISTNHHDNHNSKSAIIRPEPVIASSSPLSASCNTPSQPSSLQPHLPVTQHLPSHRPPLSLPLKPFPSSSESSSTSLPSTYQGLHPVFPALSQLSAQSAASKSERRSQSPKTPFSALTALQRSESSRSLSPKHLLNQRSGSPRSFFNQRSASPNRSANPRPVSPKSNLQPSSPQDLSARRSPGLVGRERSSSPRSSTNYTSAFENQKPSSPKLNDRRSPSLSSLRKSESPMYVSSQRPVSPRLSSQRPDSNTVISSPFSISNIQKIPNRISQESSHESIDYNNQNKNIESAISDTSDSRTYDSSSDLKKPMNLTLPPFSKPAASVLPEQQNAPKASTMVTSVYPSSVTSSFVSNFKQEMKSPPLTVDSRRPSSQEITTPITPGNEVFELKRVKTEPFEYPHPSQSVLEQSRHDPLKECKNFVSSSVDGSVKSSESGPSQGSGLLQSIKVEPGLGEESEGGASEDEEDQRGTLTPGPSDPCSEEHYKAKSVTLMKIMSRGPNNSCARCDLIFKSLTEPKRRPAPLPTTPQQAPHPSPRQPTPVKSEEKKRPETPPPNSSADAQITSNVLPSTPHHYDRHTPRSYPDTPALRQLSEYAKKPHPHPLGPDPPLSHPGFSPYPGGMDALLNYRMASMYPPGSRERLELELERDKRERDAREREMREREIREMEMREKMKHELEMKPPGLDRLLPPGPSPLDPQWLEFQRRFGYPPGALGPSSLGGPSNGSHIPGVYPPSSLASDLMQRERERIERMGIPPSPHIIPPPDLLHSGSAIAERLSAERLQAERMAFSDPVARLQMAGLGMSSQAAAAAAAAAAQSHTHTHAHSHTHLHLHQPDTPPGPPAHAFHPLGLGLNPLSSIRPGFPPGADPLAGGLGTPVSGSGPHLSSLPPGLPPHAALLSSREQELLQSDLYRRAYADPALAHQLSAQAAQHEAIQRQIAMERERLGGHFPPH